MKKPIVLVIMDGVGRGDCGDGDAVKLAKTPTLDMLLEHYPHTWLKAHGTAVGLPTDDDMGNSEVGHNALGCGQVYSQGAKLVEESITSGQLFQSKTWTDLVSNCLSQDKALHFLGLLSDGNVHSNISHLLAMLKPAGGPTSRAWAVSSPLPKRPSKPTARKPTASTRTCPPLW